MKPLFVVASLLLSVGCAPSPAPDDSRALYYDACSTNLALCSAGVDASCDWHAEHCSAPSQHSSGDALRPQLAPSEDVTCNTYCCVQCTWCSRSKTGQGDACAYCNANC